MLLSEGNTQLPGCGLVFLVKIKSRIYSSSRDLTSHFPVTESENPQHFPHEDEADADFSSHPELRIHSEEPRDAKREQDLQNSSKASVLNKREAASLLATSCCNMGCSRREISSLC